MAADWAIWGRVIHAPDAVETLPRALIAVDADGTIVSIDPLSSRRMMRT